MAGADSLDSAWYGVDHPSPSADQRNRLIALEQIEQTTQRLAARAGQSGIVLHDAQRFVARLGDELGVHIGARDPVAGQAALPDAQHIAFAAQFQIFLGDAKAIGGFPDDPEPRRLHFVERFLVEQQTG